MARINIDKLYLAIVNKDEIGTGNLTFGAPEYIPTIREFNAKAKQNTEKLYAEGSVLDQDTSLEDVEVDFDLADFTNAQYAKYCGHKLSTQGGVITNKDDIAPYIAILYQATKRGGKKTYRIYYKGKLTEPDDQVKQKEGKTNFQTNKLTATFQPLINTGDWKYSIDENDPEAPTDLATTFFNSVFIPSPDIAVPTVTTVPADSATGVAADANVVFTFSKPIQSSSVNNANIFLMKADGTLVDATLSISADSTVATLNPTTNLAVGQYVGVCTKNVMSIAGIPLANNVIVNFTV